MEFDFNRSTDSSVFPFDVLPLDIQSRILGLLPITILLICKAVSPSWRSLIRSLAFTDSYHPTRDPIFLLFSDQKPIRSALAYLPSIDRWIRFPFPARVTTGVASTAPSSVARTLIFSGRDRYTIISPFSRDRPLHLLPPVLSVGLETAVWHEGLFYYMNLCPGHFLTFDLVSGQWSMLDLDLPMSLSRCHLVSFGGDLYLTAPTGLETPSQIGISIWKLDQSAMIWREFEFYPCEFIIGGWFVVDCMGIISYGGYCSNKVLMCDLEEKRWWYSQSSTVLSDMSRWKWFGRTIEPPIDLLK